LVADWPLFLRPPGGHFQIGQKEPQRFLPNAWDPGEIGIQFRDASLIQFWMVNGWFHGDPDPASRLFFPEGILDVDDDDDDDDTV